MTATSSSTPCRRCGGYFCICPPWQSASPARRSPPVDRRVPEKTVRGEVIGFRTWHVLAADEEPQTFPTRRGELVVEPGAILLCSAGMGEAVWSPGPNRAECFAAGHPAPHEACGCGLYAWHKPDNALGYALSASGPLPAIAGVVKAWGRLEVHVDGLRAEYAQLVMFAIPEHIRVLTPELGSRIARLAGKFDARVVAAEELENAAREFGDPVDPDDRPSEKWMREAVASSVAMPLAAGGLLPGPPGPATMGLVVTGPPASIAGGPPPPESPSPPQTKVWPSFVAYAVVYIAALVLSGSWLIALPLAMAAYLAAYFVMRRRAKRARLAS